MRGKGEKRREAMEEIYEDGKKGKEGKRRDMQGEERGDEREE